MKIACIILASGNSVRFDSLQPKLFFNIYSTPIIEYTLKNILKHVNKESIYITIPKKITKNQKNLLNKFTSNRLIYGGKNRFESLKKAIFELRENYSYDYVVIHDGARPVTPDSIYKNLFKNIKIDKHECYITASRIEDTIRKNNITVDRKRFKIYQTPQAFKFKLLSNYINKVKNLPTDDLGILEKKKNLKVKFIEGSKENIKVTKLNDIILLKKLISNKIKIGNGFDLHKLRKGTYLSLAGIKIKAKFEAVGYSDGDVVLHSIIDALLGITRKGDIGKHFPAIPKYKNISSEVLINEIKNKIRYDKLIFKNIDCTIICQKIRLEKHKNDIKQKISKLLNCKKSIVNVKAKTSDKVGIIGKSRAIACWTTITAIEL